MCKEGAKKINEEKKIEGQAPRCTQRCLAPLNLVIFDLWRWIWGASGAVQYVASFRPI
jgi:hypothetical protein